MKPSNKQLLALAIAVANCAPAAVLAQSQPASDSMIEEVVVTASRRAESIQEIPYNITAITGESLKNAGVDDLSKMSQFIPGMQMIDAGARSTGLVTLRGMNVGGLQASENQGGKDIISRYVNDTPMLIDFKLVDVERVEVLRGPQGTLYGRGAMGGTLRYILNKPNTEATEGSVSTELYQNSESDGISSEVSGVLNLPLSDTLALRVSGTRVDDAGFVDYNKVLVEPGVSNDTRYAKDVNTEETTAVRTALRWEPNDQFFAQATYYLQDQKAGGRQAANPEYTGDNYTSGLLYVEPRENKDDLFNIEFGWNSDLIEIFSTTSQANFEGYGRRDQSDFLAILYPFYTDFPQYSTYTVDDNQTESLVHETRFLSTDGNSPEWLDWIAGFYYEETDTLLDAREYIPGWDAYYAYDNGLTEAGTDDLEYWHYSDDTFKERAVFGEATFHASDALQVTLGARYFKQTESVAYDCYVFPMWTGADRDCDTQSGDIDDTVFKLNAAYDFTDDVMLYATVAEGFRRGGLNFGPNLREDEKTYDSDKAVNYELGWHTTLANGRAIFNGAIFRVDWKDLQVGTKSEVAGINITGNGSQGVIDGIELSTQFSATDNLTLNGWLTYYDHGLDGDAPGIDGFDGDAFPGVPNLQANVGFDYFIPVSQGELTLRGNAYYKDEIDTKLNSIGDNDDNETLDAYTVANLSLDYRLDQWRAALFADNVTNEYYFNGGRSEKKYGERGQFYYVGQPRTVGVNLAYEF